MVEIAEYTRPTVGVDLMTEQQLQTELRICLDTNKRLAGKKTRTARADASRNAERFTEITRELKRRGLC